MLPEQLLEWNQTEVDYPRSSTIAELFALQAARTPGQIALVAGTRQLPYRKLDERSNRLARHLQSLGVGPDTLVGVAMARTESLVITLLAILKAGGAYVPLDPTYPKERLTLVIGDSRMRIVVTTEESRTLLPLDLSDLAVVNAEDPAIASLSSAPVHSSAGSHHLAYVLYTSGSTGKPKGVMLEHRNVVNFFTGMDLAIGSDPGVWLAVTSISFDISVLELLWTLTRGFTVVLDAGRGPGFVADQIARHGVTHLQMTPSLAMMLTLDSRAYAALASLRTMLLGGEAVPAPIAEPPVGIGETGGGSHAAVLKGRPGDVAWTVERGEDIAGERAGGFEDGRHGLLVRLRKERREPAEIRRLAQSEEEIPNGRLVCHGVVPRGPVFLSRANHEALQPPPRKGIDDIG